MQGTTGSSLHLLYVKLPRASISSSVAGKSSTIGEIGARGGWTLRRSSYTKCLVLHRGVPGICGLLLDLYHRVGLAGISKGDLHHRLTTKLLSINVRDSLRGPPKRSISKSRYTCIATIHGNVCESRITLSSSKRYAALKGNVKTSFVSLNFHHAKDDLRPAFVASRFNESSPSPWARTWPLSANEVEVGSARPLASTSAITTCTDAWSFEVMRRS